jgi:hypothetical protein
MIIERITEAVIYETWDGNKTVFVKEMGMVHKELENPEKSALIEDLEEAKLWGKILRASKTNATLKGVLDQAVLVYKLIDTK